MSDGDLHMKRPRLLLVDDHRSILEHAMSMLAPEFEIVGVAADGKAAVEAAAHLCPDVVVCDISMPVMSGLEAARRIRAADDRTKIVFLTVHEDEGFLEAARTAGGDGYVLKRKMATELIPAVRRALAAGQQGGAGDALPSITSSSRF